MRQLITSRLGESVQNGNRSQGLPGGAPNRSHCAIPDFLSRLVHHELSTKGADVGGQSWCRIAARAAAREIWEARFARGDWVRKNESDDTHSVVVMKRGVQRVRTVRRMPEELRWNAQLICLRWRDWCRTQHVLHRRDDLCARTSGSQQQVFSSRWRSLGALSTGKARDHVGVCW